MVLVLVLVLHRHLLEQMCELLSKQLRIVQAADEIDWEDAFSSLWVSAIKGHDQRSIVAYTSEMECDEVCFDRHREDTPFRPTARQKPCWWCENGCEIASPVSNLASVHYVCSQETPDAAA